MTTTTTRTIAQQEYHVGTIVMVQHAPTARWLTRNHWGSVGAPWHGVLIVVVVTQVVI